MQYRAGATHPILSRQIRIVGASGNNLRGVTAEIPLGLFTCVTGVSGSGKSTLIVDTLFGHAAASVTELPSMRHLASESGVSSSSIASSTSTRSHRTTPRSNPATYTGLFAPLRESLPQSPKVGPAGTTRADSAST